MPTVKQYSLNLWKVQKVIMSKLGLNVSWSGPEDKARAMTEDIMLGTLLKVLVDKGLVTDAELNAAYTTVATATFPPGVWAPPPPLGEGDPADPDLGV